MDARKRVVFVLTTIWLTAAGCDRPGVYEVDESLSDDWGERRGQVSVNTCQDIDVKVGSYFVRIQHQGSSLKVLREVVAPYNPFGTCLLIDKGLGSLDGDLIKLDYACERKYIKSDGGGYCHAKICDEVVATVSGDRISGERHRMVTSDDGDETCQSVSVPCEIRASFTWTRCDLEPCPESACR